MNVENCVKIVVRRDGDRIAGITGLVATHIHNQVKRPRFGLPVTRVVEPGAKMRRQLRGY